MTTVPFKASELLAYVNGWRPEHIDLSMSQLTPRQTWNYLSFLKIEDKVINVSPEQLAAYMTTTDYVRVARVDKIVKQVLYFVRFCEMYPHDESPWCQEEIEYFVENYHDICISHCLLLKSLPALLSKAKGGETSFDCGERYDDRVGVNFVNTFSDPQFLISVVPDALAQDICWIPYYNKQFESYMYGGDNLIWFVNKNPDNLFFQAML